jgi:hypothetical protein
MGMWESLKKKEEEEKRTEWNGAGIQNCDVDPLIINKKNIFTRIIIS